MANRKRLHTFGRRGQLVRVFTEAASGAAYVRVQWTEHTGAPLRTESWRDTKANRATAKAYADGVAQRLAAGHAPERREPTLRELRDAHLLAHAEAWAPATRRNFLHRWGRFESYVGRHTQARLVSEATLDEFRARLRALGVATNQRGETVKVVKQVFRWARRRGLLGENPIGDYTIKLAKGEKKTDVPEFAPDEVAAIRAQMAREAAHRAATTWRLAVAIELDAATGARQKALRHLRWADVNLSGAAVRHPIAPDVEIPPRCVWWAPEFDKLAKGRMQPLPRGAVHALRVAKVWRARLGYAGPWVFAGATATSRGVVRVLTGWQLDPKHKKVGRTRRTVKDQPWTYSALNQALRELCARAGVAWITGRAMHGLRKFIANEVAGVTRSERAAADWIGDTDVKVVRKHYLKVRAEEMREVAELIRPGGRGRRETATKAQRPAGKSAGRGGKSL